MAERICPECGLPALDAGTAPAAEVCSPLTCKSWTHVQSYDHERREWVPAETLSCGHPAGGRTMGAWRYCRLCDRWENPDTGSSVSDAEVVAEARAVIKAAAGKRPTLVAEVDDTLRPIGRCTVCGALSQTLVCGRCGQ